MKRWSLANGLLACWLIKKCGASVTGSLSNIEMEMTNDVDDDGDENDDDDDDDDDKEDSFNSKQLYFLTLLPSLFQDYFISVAAIYTLKCHRLPPSHHTIHCFVQCNHNM